MVIFWETCNQVDILPFFAEKCLVWVKVVIFSDNSDFFHFCAKWDIFSVCILQRCILIFWKQIGKHKNKVHTWLKEREADCCAKIHLLQRFKSASLQFVYATFYQKVSFVGICNTSFKNSTRKSQVLTIFVLVVMGKCQWENEFAQLLARCLH